MSRYIVLQIGGAVINYRRQMTKSPRRGVERCPSAWERRRGASGRRRGCARQRPASEGGPGRDVSRGVSDTLLIRPHFQLPPRCIVRGRDTMFRPSFELILVTQSPAVFRGRPPQRSRAARSVDETGMRTDY